MADNNSSALEAMVIDIAKSLGLTRFFVDGAPVSVAQDEPEEQTPQEPEGA